MSLKSRNRTDKKQILHPTDNPLFLQQQSIRNAMLDYFGVSLLFFFFDIVIIVLGFLDKSISSPKTGIIHGILMISVIFICYLVASVRRYSIFKKLSKIKFSTEQSVSVYCRKVQLFLHPESRFSSVVLCVVLLDKNGNKFYYVYPEKSAPSPSFKKRIKEKYIGCNIELICYKDTNIVKFLPSQE